MKNLSSGKVKGLRSPIQLPDTESVANEWQLLNRAWWENQPMRYDWNGAIGIEPGSKEFFQEIDRRFFDSVRHYMPWRKEPFDSLISFSNLGSKDILEIGTGHGSHAQLMAPFSKSFTGIDLTEKATFATRKRLELFEIPARILCMDAEHMTFPDRSFDFIWSWGVIHHSANPPGILREMHRVLRPDGEAVIMVYHRSFWGYYLTGGFFRPTDGALARFYRPTEWQKLCEGLFEIKRFIITGQKTDVLPLPAGSFKRALEKIVPDSVSRVLTNRFKMGSFLIAEMIRKDSVF